MTVGGLLGIEVVLQRVGSGVQGHLIDLNGPIEPITPCEGQG